MRMPHRCDPCSQQAHASSTHAPETEPQEEDHRTAGCRSCPVPREMAWIPGVEIHRRSDRRAASAAIRIQIGTCVDVISIDPF
jgi:hypothetical protein